MDSPYPHAVLREAMQRSDECVELGFDGPRTAYLRWDADGDRFEAVEIEYGRVSERYHPEDVYAASLVATAVASAGIEGWHPVEFFAATCNPGDRPPVRA